KRKIGLLGGSFDPIHKGHIICAKAAKDHFNLDEVILIPAGKPHFKNMRNLERANHRINMCKLAIEGLDDFSVSLVDTKRKGITYTIDTLREIKRDYDDADLYFIMGSDNVSELASWKTPEELKDLAKFVVVCRPGFKLDKECKAFLKEFGFVIKCIETDALDISSTDLRKKLSELPSDVSKQYKIEFLEKYVSEQVGEYILKKRLYFSKQEEESPRLAFAKKMIEKLKDRVDQKRYEHTLGVARTCVNLANIYNVDVQEAFLAGILHDWDKCYDKKKIQRRVRDLRMRKQTTDIVYENITESLHPETAAIALKREYKKEIPDSVIQAISNHTIGAIDTSDLDKILYISDAIEPGRSYADVEDLRNLVGVVPLDDLFFKV
ncbi:MAG: nicotinate-nucleotide adenylyltransferase, partial [Eggerthellaceae bacterium]|nr:nicotinate-nucleotide adenylyltransferase [Eggerthellaceae bacterium]